MKLSDTKSYHIQILRGLAIISVVFIHNTPNGLLQVWCRPFLNFAVGLFLFLSGMLSDVENWNPKKRIIKVIVPYMVWSFIYVIMANYRNPALIPISYIKNIITGRSAAIMYYVFIYCEFTLLMPFIDKLAKSEYKYLGFVISPIEIIIMRLLPLMTGYKVNPYVSIIMGISCLGWFSYYYLGYMLGNNLIEVKIQTFKLGIIWIGSIVLQIIEGYWYLSMGEINCGTQMKLTSILSGTVFVMLAFRFINSERKFHAKILHLLGDCSFGIYFSHLAIMAVLGLLPNYSKIVIYPFNAVVAIIISLICVLIGKKLLGKNSKYLAL